MASSSRGPSPVRSGGGDASQRTSRGDFRARTDSTASSVAASGSVARRPGQGTNIDPGEWDRQVRLLTDLHGHHKQLNHRVTELYNTVIKKSITADEAQKLREESSRMRSEFAELLRSSAAQAEMRREILELQKGNQELQAHVQDLRRQVVETQQAAASISGQQAQAMAAIKEEFAASKRVIEEQRRSLQTLQQGSSASEAKQAELSRALEGAKSEMTAKHKEMAAKHDELHGKHKELHGQTKELHTKHETIIKEVTVAKESVENVKSEMSGQVDKLKKENAEQKAKFLQVKHALDQGPASQVEVIDLRRNFQDLHKKLLDRGVLNPPRPPQEEEEETPIVGTLELDEDVFSARMLLRLGYLKARSEASKTDCGSDSDDYGSEPILYDENVAGLALPEIEEGQKGYDTIMQGSLAISIVTLFLQYLIVFVIYKDGADNGDGCVKVAMTDMTWWTVHSSKAAAVIFAGAFLGKDIMDAVNYGMTSQLLEPHTNVEVAITTVLRLGLSAFIAIANIALFKALAAPSQVWMGAGALAFVSDLGKGIVDVARKGVFGHPIAKTMTNINFQLCFVSEYPEWFLYVRTITLIIVVAFTFLAAGLAFNQHVPVCTD